MRRAILKLIGAIIITLLLIILGAGMYLGEFTSQSIQMSSPLQLLSGFTSPLRNMSGLYGLISFIIGLLLALCFAAWLYIKEQRELKKHAHKHKPEH